jgi:endonuclease/exonuclease/phosphatase (EEP) superfamily protein YafD
MDEFKPFEKVGFRLANGGAFGTFLTHRRRNTAFTPAIDNVLVKGFDILSVRTEDDSMILSDHRMLVCRLRAKGSPSKEGGM